MCVLYPFCQCLYVLYMLDDIIKLDCGTLQFKFKMAVLELLNPTFTVILTIILHVSTMRIYKTKMPLKQAYSHY